MPACRVAASVSGAEGVPVAEPRSGGGLVRALFDGRYRREGGGLGASRRCAPRGEARDQVAVLLFQVVICCVTYLERALAPAIVVSSAV